MGHRQAGKARHLGRHRGRRLPRSGVPAWRLDPLNLNLRDVCEIGILREDNETVSDAGRRTPDIHDPRTAPGSSSLPDDRGKGTSDFRIDGDRVVFALNPAYGSKAAGPGLGVFGT